MKPGQPFRKTWRIRNTGSGGMGRAATSSSSSPTIQMGGPDAVPLPPTLPGEETDVSVDLVAPMQAGKALGTWQPRDRAGQAL